MAWIVKPEPVDLSTFDPNSSDYTSDQLEAYADAMLKEDIKENGNQNHILFKEHLAARARREIKVGSGVVDDMITAHLPKSERPGVTAGDGQMLYNRTHPRGRKVNSREQRAKNGASYYR